MEVVRMHLKHLQDVVDEGLKNQPPWKVVFYAAAATYTFSKMKEFLWQDKSKKILFGD